jgi:flagellar basal-body rod protein FlgF
MAGGAYTALSGLRARTEQLDRLASDIANAATAGYKAERSSTVATERETFEGALMAAIDVVPGARRVDFRDGNVVATGRDLDLAIEGRGFFAVDTPGGERYTRNGHFLRRPDGTLGTSDGFELAGESGPIRLEGNGAITVSEDGTIRVGAAVAGKVKIVDFDDYTQLTREGSTRFRAADTATPKDAEETAIKGGALEQSNVSVVERIAQLTEVSRGFEGLQRGIAILTNDLDTHAINALGRK